MAATCCLVDCTSRLENKGVKLFKLTERRKKIWEKALVHHPMSEKKRTVICNKHFETKCFGKGKELKKGAVPTLFHYNGIKVNDLKHVLRDHSYCFKLQIFKNLKENYKKKTK